jgi:hypothetical protein
VAGHSDSGSRVSKDPVFSTVAIVPPALATGANTALFGLLNGLVWRDIAVRDAKTLVQVSAVRPGSISGTGLTFPVYEELQRGHRMFSAVIGWLGPSIVNVETDHKQTQAAVWVVSGNVLSAAKGVEQSLRNTFTGPAAQLDAVGRDRGAADVGARIITAL